MVDVAAFHHHEEMVGADSNHVLQAFSRELAQGGRAGDAVDGVREVGALRRAAE